MRVIAVSGLVIVLWAWVVVAPIASVEPTVVSCETVAAHEPVVACETDTECEATAFPGTRSY